MGECGTTANWMGLRMSVPGKRLFAMVECRDAVMLVFGSVGLLLSAAPCEGFGVRWECIDVVSENVSYVPTRS